MKHICRDFSIYLILGRFLPTLLSIPALLSSGCSKGNPACFDDSVSRKASGRIQVYTNSPYKGMAIRKADIFTFNDDKLQRLDSWQCFTDTYAWSALSRTGKKKIAVIANYGYEKEDWAVINSYHALANTKANYTDDSLEEPLMTGTVNASNSGKMETSVSVSLSPILAKISLTGLRCDFTGKEYAGESIKNVKIYLTNISSIASLFGEDASPSSYVNFRAYREMDMKMMRCPEMAYAEGIADVGINSSGFSRVCLYCFPNTCPEDTVGSPFTRLVIEGEIQGRIYYWPVNINREGFGYDTGEPGISRGAHYALDITLTGKGTDDPDLPASGNQLRINSRILPWNVFDAGNVDFTDSGER